MNSAMDITGKLYESVCCRSLRFQWDILRNEERMDPDALLGPFDPILEHDSLDMLGDIIVAEIRRGPIMKSEEVTEWIFKEVVPLGSADYPIMDFFILQNQATRPYEPIEILEMDLLDGTRFLGAFHEI